MTLAMLWNRSIFQNNKTDSLLKSHSGEVKIELSAVRRGRRPVLNSGSGCEPSSPHTTIFGAILIEISTNCSQYSLLWALCHWLPVSLNNSTFKKQTGTNHTAILTVYSMVPWGFWETIFFSFFSLLLFWLSSKEKKNYSSNWLARCSPINMFWKRSTGCANRSCEQEQENTSKVSVRP